ncbi:MAG: YhcH/YjgK/YiaL family protein [bacterium]|nr:YhcH/YjgK/YiaL family protein [bacterium]
MAQFITDQLENAEACFSLHPLLERAFAFLRAELPEDAPDGRVDIDGDRMFCLVSTGQGRGRQNARLEAHRRYIDLQFVLSGTDVMGWKPLKRCLSPESDFDAERDIVFFRDDASVWKTVQAGSFALFFPDDAHAPMGGEGLIRKAVVKIAV